MFQIFSSLLLFSSIIRCRLNFMCCHVVSCHHHPCEWKRDFWLLSYKFLGVRKSSSTNPKKPVMVVAWYKFRIGGKSMSTGTRINNPNVLTSQLFFFGCRTRLRRWRSPNVKLKSLQSDTDERLGNEGNHRGKIWCAQPGTGRSTCPLD